MFKECERPWLGTGAMGRSAGEGLSRGSGMRGLPLLQREAPLQRPSSLEVILVVPLPLDRPRPHMLLWWHWRGAVKRGDGSQVSNSLL